MRRFALFPSLIGLLALITGLLTTATSAQARVLELVDRIVDADLAYLQTLEISPDGRFVYVSGSATVRFERNPSTGALTYVEADRGASSISISPDGRSLYSSRFEGLEVCFRDAVDGTTTLAETWGREAFGHGGSTEIWLSPDARHVYVLGYDFLAVFARSPLGVLTLVQVQHAGVDGVRGLYLPGDLAFGPEGRYVYVVGEIDPETPLDSLAIFSRDPVTGTLTFQDAVTQDAPGLDALENPGAVQVSQDGRNLYVVAATGVLAFERDPADGSVSLLDVEGVGGQILAMSSDDRFLYALRSGPVHILSRSPDTGELDLVETYELDPSVSSVEGAKISPDDRHLYVAATNEFPVNGSVSVYSRDLGTGQLTFSATYSDDVDEDAEGLERAQSAVVSPDGRHVYVGSESSELQLAAFSHTPGPAGLSYLGSYGDWAGDGPFDRVESMTFGPEGRQLYLTFDSSTDDQLVVLERNTETGELDLLETHVDGAGGVDGLANADSLVVTPDGRHVYVAGPAELALAVFERDLATGRLTFLRAYFDGVAGVDGLGRISDLVISPSGGHLYATSPGDRNLGVFARDADTGELTLLEVDRSSRYTGLAMSPDGRNLYAEVLGEDLAVFTRDPATGLLNHIESLDDTGWPLVSADGEYVVAASGRISVFRRDFDSGRLTLLESLDLRSVSDPNAVAWTQDREHLFVAGAGLRPPVLDAFRMAPGPCSSSYDGLCLGDDRFRVELDWRDFEGNTGIATPVRSGSDDSGILWFFGEDNWEMQLKVLDACDLNDRFWVFAAATTNVEYTLRVIDVVADVTKTYFNPLGNAANAITDTDAFATCSTPTAFRSNAGSRTDVVDLSTFQQGGGSVVDRRAYRRAPEPSLDKALGGGQLKGLDGKCLDIEGGDLADGTPAILFDCHGGDNQRWFRGFNCGTINCEPGFELGVLGGKCLQPGPDAGSGFRPLEVGPCDGPEDRWETTGHFPQEFSLVHMETGLCADVLGSSTDNFTPVGLFECHEGANQTWEFDEYECQASPAGACKNDDRFLVEVEWRDFDGNTGNGRVLPQETDDSGLFWFFGPDNWEMLVKVLDACTFNDHFWVFSAATTNVEYTLRVTDTETREVREYFNPLGNAAPAITDTSAFATCDAP